MGDTLISAIGLEQFRGSYEGEICQSLQRVVLLTCEADPVPNSFMPLVGLASHIESILSGVQSTFSLFY